MFQTVFMPKYLITTCETFQTFRIACIVVTCDRHHNQTWLHSSPDKHNTKVGERGFKIPIESHTDLGILFLPILNEHCEHRTYFIHFSYKTDRSTLMNSMISCG